MKQLKIALDWTANTNHSGFYIAKQKGFYAELDIDLEIHTPAEDNYKLTPAKKVEQEKCNTKRYCLSEVFKSCQKRILVCNSKSKIYGS